MRFCYQFKICVIRRCFAALVSIVVDELDFCFQFEEREIDLFFSFRYDRIIALPRISILAHAPFFASNLRLSDNCNYRCLDTYSNLLIIAKFISLISYYYEMNVNLWFWLDNVAVI